MRTEQDVEADVTVWTRKRQVDYLNPVYSDERPSKREVIISLALICVILGVVFYFCLPLLGVGL